MSTRATYQIIETERPTITFYIHHDGYEIGAANYFAKMLESYDKPLAAYRATSGGYAEAFIRGIENAEITSSHKAHGDTEFSYTLKVEKEFTNGSTQRKLSLVVGRKDWDANEFKYQSYDFIDFMNEYINGYCEAGDPTEKVFEFKASQYSLNTIYTKAKFDYNLSKEREILNEYLQKNVTEDNPNMVSLRQRIANMEAFILNGYELPTIKEGPKTEVEQIAEAIEAEKPFLAVVEYSEKAIAVFGDTKSLKDRLKEIGGKFNPCLNWNGVKSAGWVFSKSKQDAVALLVMQLVTN